MNVPFMAGLALGEARLWRLATPWRPMKSTPIMMLALCLWSLTVPAAVHATTLPASFQETTVVTGLSSPTAMEFAPDGRLFVTEKGGSLRIIKNGALLSTPFVTVPVNTSSERGLLGIAFDPNFSSNRFLYVYYTRAAAPIKNRVSRFTASAANPDVAQAGSELVILDDVSSDAGNHNGGAIHFGLDGTLYIGIGDGGSTSSNSQSLGTLNGKLLRINPDGSVPADNPFVGATGAMGQIWALGLRNPFTFSVEPGTGKIYINDVGQNTWEEIDPGIKGANYGWPTCEGTCSTSGMTNPLYAYNHSLGCAITGGAFYRASQFPAAYMGSYFFSDYCSTWIKMLRTDNTAADFATGTTGSVVDLKVGSDGALYSLSISNGAVYRMAYANPNRCDLNTDATTNALDLQLLVNAILSPAPPAANDLNRDGAVNVLDLQILANVILGTATCP